MIIMGMCWAGRMMGVIWEKHWSLKWNARGSKDDQKEDVKDASGERKQECWFGEAGCHELSEMESRSWKDCLQIA